MAGTVERSEERIRSVDVSDVNFDACIAPEFDIHRISVIPTIVDRYFTGFSDAKAGEFERKFMSSAVVPLQQGDYTFSHIPDRKTVQKELLYLRDRVKALDAQSCWEASYEHTERMREVGRRLFEKANEYGLVERVTKPFIRKRFDNVLHSLNNQSDVERLMGNMGWKVISATNGEYICVARVGKRLTYFSVDQLAQIDPKFLQKQLKTYYKHSIYGQALRGAAVHKAFHEREASDVTPAFIREIARLEDDSAYNAYKHITNVLAWFDRVDDYHHNKNRSRNWVLELHGLDVSRNWQVTDSDNTSLFSLSQVLRHLSACKGLTQFHRTQYDLQLEWLQAFDNLQFGVGEKALWIDDADIARFDRPRVPTKEEIANTRAFIRSADDFTVAVASWLQGRESRHTAYDLLGLLRDIRPQMAEGYNSVKDMVKAKTDGTAHSFHSLMADVERRLSPPFFTPLTVESVRTIVKKEFEKAGIQSLAPGSSYEIQTHGQLGLAMQDLLGWVALEQVRDAQNRAAKKQGKQPPDLHAIDTYLQTLVADWQTAKTTQFEVLQKAEMRAIEDHKAIVRELHINERELTEICDSDRTVEPYPEWQLTQLAYLIRQRKLDVHSRATTAFLSSFFPWLTVREYSWLLKYSTSE
jgi:hypothetical protein